VPLADWDDATLMRSLAEGETEALGELVHRYQDRALSLAYRMLGNWPAAEDTVQEAFLRVYRAAPRYHPSARFMTWLYRIVTNLCLDERRKVRKAPVALPDETTLPDPAPAEDPVEADERARMVREAVADLPHRQRAVLVLHRYERLSYAEVAEVTGWSASAVESLLVRAYAQLRKRLSDLSENP
jgi:RNA polymerase sigma-70 factor (ECF subfamily)